MFFRHLKGHIEALLFVSGEPLAASKMSQILEIDEEHVVLLLEELKREMDSNDDSGLTISEVAGGYQMCTKPKLALVVEKLSYAQESRLSTAAMETLAIIAFKQPITRQEIEAIRGVKIDRVLNTLVERRLIKEVGRKEALGRPILFGTTNEFLNCCGLKSLQDLPPIANLIDSRGE